MENKHNSLSVVICTQNRCKDLLCALHSIRSQTLLPDEIVIVDGSLKRLIDDPSFTAVFNKQTFPRVNLLYRHLASGLTKKRNEGIRMSSGDVLYFFDDDVKLSSNYLAEMQDVFLRNTSYAGGMGSVTNIEHKTSAKYAFFRRFFLLQRDCAHGRFTLSGMPTHAYGRKTFLEVEVLGGCCFAFRRGVIKRYLFDETLCGYAPFEDCEISKRIANNHVLFFNPKAQLEHFNSPVARDRMTEVRAMHIHNYSYMFFKNFYPRAKYKILFYVWSVLGLFVESILFRRFQEMRGYCKGLWRFFRGR